MRICLLQNKTNGGLIMENKAKYITFISMMIALMIAVKMVMIYVPNVTIATAVIIAITLHFGVVEGLLVSAMYPLMTGMISGIGLWTPFQIICWAIVVLATILIKPLLNKFSDMKLAVIGFIFAYLFGVILNTCMASIYGTMGMGLMAFYIASVPFDLAHAISTAVVLPILIRVLKILNK